MSDRTLLVGGLSSLHDPLFAAALRGSGLAAEALHERRDAGLRAARGLGNHGQCNPAHYSVGAVLEHAAASPLPAARFAARRAWLTVGSCGPCRLAAFGLEYRRVLAGAGLGDLPIISLDQLAFVGGEGGPAPIPLGAARRLLAALVAGDLITAVGHHLRPWVLEAELLEGLLVEARDRCAAALEEGGSLGPPLAALGAAAAALPVDCSRTLPRLLLVGEPWTVLTDGDPSYDLARRLAWSGAEVEVPRASDWLRHLLWEARVDEARGKRPDLRRLGLLEAADRRLRALWRRLSVAVGLAPWPLDDPAMLAAEAAPHYAAAVRGGSGHLEVARALRARRLSNAHLVISVKPFGCLPSSALSDGILATLLRQPGGPAFLAVETTGSADAIVESRVEMALHAASLAAVDELETVAGVLGLDAEAARRRLRARGEKAWLVRGPRRVRATSAELLLRHAAPRG